jgi:hypothetical protein
VLEAHVVKEVMIVESIEEEQRWGIELPLAILRKIEFHKWFQLHIEGFLDFYFWHFGFFGLDDQFLEVSVADEAPEAFNDSSDGSKFLKHLLMVASALVRGTGFDEAAQFSVNPPGLLLLDT